MLKKKEHDIIIVGSGPVGSYTAYLLAKEGFDVGIFERKTSIGKDVNCTGIVSRECFYRFALPPHIILKKIHSIRAVSPSGNSLSYMSGLPVAYVVDRGLLDYEMNQMACKEGAACYLDANVQRAGSVNGAFSITVQQGKETAREWTAKAGVIATGFEINGLQGLCKKPMSFLFGIQTDVIMRDISDVEVYFGKKVAPGSFGWVVPTNGNSAKIGLMAEKNPAKLLKGFLRHPLIEQRLDSCTNSVKCSPIPLKRVSKSYDERLLIVGEAAGQVKTTTGGGIYFGLLCAEIAANTLIKAFRQRDFSEKTLKEYEVIWHRKIAPELKAGSMMRSIFSRFSDRQIDHLVDLAKRNGIMPVIENASFDWHKGLIQYLIRHFVSKKLFAG
jgi:geranylgeranyl reductase family protein